MAKKNQTDQTRFAHRTVLPIRDEFFVIYGLEKHEAITFLLLGTILLYRYIHHKHFHIHYTPTTIGTMDETRHVPHTMDVVIERGKRYSKHGGNMIFQGVQTITSFNFIDYHLKKLLLKIKFSRFSTIIFTLYKISFNHIHCATSSHPVRTSKTL
jgi:hypothetical protein